MSKKRQALSLKRKVKIIEEAEKRKYENKEDLAKSLGLTSAFTLSTILDYENSLLKQCSFRGSTVSSNVCGNQPPFEVDIAVEPRIAQSLPGLRFQRAARCPGSRLTILNEVG